LWQKVLESNNPYDQPANTSLKESWPYTYVYCYRLKITIRGHTTKCPPYVFRLNATLPWNTTDNNYVPQITEYDRTIDIQPLTHEIHEVHFRDNEHLVDENLAIDRVLNLTAQLELLHERNLALNLPVAGGKITYATAFHSILVTITVLVLFLIALVIYKSLTDRKQHRKVMQTVTDGIYGDGTYETIKVRKRSSQTKPKKTVGSTSPTNITQFVTMNARPNSEPPELPSH